MGHKTGEQPESVRKLLEAGQFDVTGEQQKLVKDPPDLTDDERAVLEIGTTTTVIPIGRWKKSVEAMIARGFMLANDSVNVVTTVAGKLALEAAENKVFGELVDKAREVETPHNEIRLDVESAAHLLARIASRSARVTGKPPVYEAREWANVLLKRTLEILGG